MICWCLLGPAGVPVLVSLLLSSLVPVLVPLLLSSFFPQEKVSVPSWFAGSSWFRLGFRCLSPFFSLLWFLCLFPFFSLLSFLRTRCLSPFSSFFPQDRGSVASWFAGSSWFRLGFRCLSPFLLSSLVPVLVSLLLSSFFPQERVSVPSWFAGSSWFQRACLPFFSLLSFLRKGFLFHHGFPGSSCFGLGFRRLSPFSLFFLSFFCVDSWMRRGVSFIASYVYGWSDEGVKQKTGVPDSTMNFELHMTMVETCVVAVWDLCWCNFLRKGVLFHHGLLVPLGSGWGSGACLPSFLLSSGKEFCSIMICWFFLASFSPQEKGSVPSWFAFAGSSWFRLGFRCLSPFFSLLSSLRKGVLFHHDLLIPLGSGWASGACLPLFSLLWFRCLSPFFSLLSFLRKGVLFHLDLLVPPGSGWGSGPFPFFSLLSFLRKGFLFHHGFPGSSCFGLGFRCLSPFSLFFSLFLCGFLDALGRFFYCLVIVRLKYWRSKTKTEDRRVPDSTMNFEMHMTLLETCVVAVWGLCCCNFLRKRVLFHHDLLVPLGSGWGSGACLPSSLFFLSSGKGFCSIMICWFLLGPAGVPVLVTLLLSSLVPVLVSLLLSSFFPQDRGSVPSWGFLFHHDLLVPPGSGWGSGACLRSSLFFLSSGKGFCSIMICWFFLSSFFPQEKGSVPSWFAGSSWFRLGFRCLSPFFSLLSSLRKGVLFHHNLLIPLGSGWASGACLPSSLFFGSGACLPSSPFFLSSGKGFCSIMICWFLLVPAGVPVLVSLLLSSFFPQERGPVPSWISWFLLLWAGVPALVSLLAFFSSFFCVDSWMCLGVSFIAS